LPDILIADQHFCVGIYTSFPPGATRTGILASTKSVTLFKISASDGTPFRDQPGLLANGGKFFLPVVVNVNVVRQNFQFWDLTPKLF
jgi:hypothetical protein